MARTRSLTIRLLKLDVREPEDALTTRLSALCLDKKLVVYGGARSKVEICDILTKERDFSFVFKRDGEAEKIIKTGESFFEPAGVTTERFDNALSTEPAEIIAFYLTDSKDRALIEMLGTK